MTTIKKNFAYRSALTLSNYLMGFITFPYVARVLEVDRIGLVNFVDNTVNYFLLFATMGIGLLGVREVASVKHDKAQLSHTFSNLLGINLLFTVATLVVYIALVLTVPKFNQYSELFYIGSAKILFTALIAEWFFTGIENFRYITVRSLAIRALYVIAVFIFIKEQADYKLYFILTVGVVVVNALINCAYLTRFIRISLGSMLKLRYLKQNCVLGVYSIMTSMYLTFNVMFLGFVSDNIQVGYYTTAFKIYMVVLGLFTAFTNVMLPRMSSLLAQGESDQFNTLVGKSFRAMCTFSIPMIVFSFILAPQLIHIIAGDGYEGAITPMRILMPAALFVGMAQVLAIQVLAPMKCDRQLFIASVIGAVVSLAVNVSAVWFLKSEGSALVLLLSEISVTAYYIGYVAKKRYVTVPYGSVATNVGVAVPIAIICLVAQLLLSNPFIAVGVAFGVTVIYWEAMRRIVFHGSKYL